jgi:hypothetical protein
MRNPAWKDTEQYNCKVMMLKLLILTHAWPYSSFEVRLRALFALLIYIDTFQIQVAKMLESIQILLIP